MGEGARWTYPAPPAARHKQSVPSLPTARHVACRTHSILNTVFADLVNAAACGVLV